MLTRKVGVFVCCLGLLCSVSLHAQKKKKNDPDLTQTLAELRDPPASIVADTSHLVFHVTSLSAKGLLSAQVRDALKSLVHDKNLSLVKIRAFVSGSGDLRRIPSIVSEVFTERKIALPVVTTVQVGALPMEGAQVILEIIGLDKRAVNPNGLAFFSGQSAKDVKEAAAKLQTAAAAAGVRPGSVLRVTCFLSSLEMIQNARTAITGAFPAAAVNYVQPQRLALEPNAECEAVGRLDAPLADRVELLNPPELAKNPNFSQIAKVNARSLVFTSIQMAFRDQNADIRLAFERLQKQLATQKVTFKDVVWSSFYPLTRPVSDRASAIRFEFIDHARPPASTRLLFEGLPALDASVAVEVVAATPGN